MRTDEELVRRGKARDEQALEELLRRYESRVFSYLLRMLGRHADAEDATEETFVKAIGAMHRYRERGQFKSWLFRIAHREGLRSLRSRHTRENATSGEEALLEVSDPLPGPDAAVLSREAVLQIEKAIDGLPAAERETVALRVYGGLAFKEIAVVMKCSINTALGRMRNAGKRLKPHLDAV